jgi:hypothetical protein
MAKLAIFLIMAVLAVAIIACDGSESYELSISSTSGGSVTSPGEGVFAYNAGTVVELVATADDGYEFHVWTGDIEDITNLNSTSTNITINGDYTITANFEEEGGPDPSKPY